MSQGPGSVLDFRVLLEALLPNVGQQVGLILLFVLLPLVPPQQRGFTWPEIHRANLRRRRLLKQSKILPNTAAKLVVILVIHLMPLHTTSWHIIAFRGFRE